jgi:hypothetical protein
MLAADNDQRSAASPRRLLHFLRGPRAHERFDDDALVGARAPPSRGRSRRSLAMDCRSTPVAAVSSSPRGWLLCWPSRKAWTTPARFCDSSNSAAAVSWNRASTDCFFRGNRRASDRSLTASWQPATRPVSQLAKSESAANTNERPVLLRTRYPRAAPGPRDEDGTFAASQRFVLH